MATPTRILIVGGGFGGAECARVLSRKLPREVELTLVDRRNFLLFYPLLVEAGVGNLEPRHVVVPIRHFLKRGHFLMRRVEAIDLERKTVTCRSEDSGQALELSYDRLVLAPGSVTRLPPVPGLREHGFELKSLADSIALRDHGIRLLEEAQYETDPERRKALLTVVVVGSNFTGTEFAGEYHDFLTQMARAYATVPPKEIRVVLIEKSERILPALDEGLASYAARHLQKRGMRILTGNTLTLIERDRVTLETGETLPCRTAVWCAGILPNPLLATIPELPLDERGYLLCDEHLRVQGFEDVWAVGDSAHLLAPNGRPYAATAQNATRQGAHAAHNILRQLRKKPLVPFRHQELGSIAALGCRTAVAKVLGVKLSGWPAWWLYRTVYFFKMPSLSRRLRIALDWTLDLVFRPEPVQLGVHRVPPAREPEV